MVKSPCINICEIDPKNKICIGCGRTEQEIFNWSYLGSKEKGNIINKIQNMSELINKPLLRKKK